jgi:hypothetical protein
METGALLACGEGADLSHHTASALWALRSALPPTIEVTVSGRDPGQRPGVRLHRVRHLAQEDRTHRYGLPVTTPARTVLDLAAVLAPRDLERTIDEARRQRLVTDASLIAAVQRATAAPERHARRSRARTSPT